LLSSPHITNNQAPPRGDGLSITKSPESSGDLKEAPVDGRRRLWARIGQCLRIALGHLPKAALSLSATGFALPLHAGNHFEANHLGALPGSCHPVRPAHFSCSQRQNKSQEKRSTDRLDSPFLQITLHSLITAFKHPPTHTSPSALISDSFRFDHTRPRTRARPHS
jgi:hypothetical protein